MSSFSQCLFLSRVTIRHYVPLACSGFFFLGTFEMALFLQLLLVSLGCAVLAENDGSAFVGLDGNNSLVIRPPRNGQVLIDGRMLIDGADFRALAENRKRFCKRFRLSSNKSQGGVKGVSPWPTPPLSWG
jgi:hypothetical protein